MHAEACRIDTCRMSVECLICGNGRIQKLHAKVCGTGVEKLNVSAYNKVMHSGEGKEGTSSSGCSGFSFLV